MRRTSILAGVMFMSVLLMGTANAAEKVGYVNLSKIFSEYSKTKEYDKVLTSKETAYTQERDKKVNEIKQFQEKMNLLSDKEKEAKKTDLENKVNALQEFDRQKQTDLRKEQEEKMKEIFDDIEKAVASYAKKEGYTMVFNDRVLVYEDQNLDITNKIISIVNASKPSGK